MQVRAHEVVAEDAVHTPDTVAPTGEHPAQSPFAGTECGTAAVVLEAGERRERQARIRLDHDLADDAIGAGAGGHVDQSEPVEPLAIARFVAVTDELEAGAHREDHRAAGSGLLDRRGTTASRRTPSPAGRLRRHRTGRCRATRESRCRPRPRPAPRRSRVGCTVGRGRPRCRDRRTSRGARGRRARPGRRMSAGVTTTAGSGG